jgi:hypothetical protein
VKDRHPLIKKDAECILFLKKQPPGNIPRLASADYWCGVQHPSPWMFKSLRRLAGELSSKRHLLPADVVYELLKEYPKKPIPLSEINTTLQKHGSWKCQAGPHHHTNGVSHYSLLIHNEREFPRWMITVTWRKFQDGSTDRITLNYGKTEGDAQQDTRAQGKEKSLNLNTPEATLRSYQAAVKAQDWITAEACLARELRDMLKDAIADRSFFDQYLVAGFATKTLEVIPVRHVTEEDIAALSSNDVPRHPGPRSKRFTAQVGHGGGATPWIATCTFIHEKYGWTLTAKRIKRKEDFDRWHLSAIADPDRGSARKRELQQRINRVDLGMSRREVEILLPCHPLSPQVTIAQGGAQVTTFWLDRFWKVSHSYDYTGIPRDDEGKALSPVSSKNKLLAIPKLIRDDMPLPVKTDRIEDTAAVPIVIPPVAKPDSKTQPAATKRPQLAAPTDVRRVSIGLTAENSFEHNPVKMHLTLENRTEKPITVSSLMVTSVLTIDDVENKLRAVFHDQWKKVPALPAGQKCTVTVLASWYGIKDISAYADHNIDWQDELEIGEHAISVSVDGQRSNVARFKILADT